MGKSKFKQLELFPEKVDERDIKRGYKHHKVKVDRKTAKWITKGTVKKLGIKKSSKKA